MVFDDPSPHEPDEYDPEADLPDPEHELVSIPEVSTDEGDVPQDLLLTFWIMVAVLNVAIMAIAVGLILLVFGYDLVTSLGLVGGGLVLAGLAYRRYRSFRIDSDDDAYGSDQ
ncbi:MAG: hypothetical protein U5K37_01690 [Natrialbaceae archaeon]|nr:hypothetical protein [Natrialbaceae archaeon]